jgi:NADH-quinone oxidoreductase subunit J
MPIFAHPIQWLLGSILVLSSLGVILARKPVHASLSFLLTLLTLATFYLQLSAQFIAVMQILVYAGAILVIFMYVVVLFQDAHMQISRYEPASSPLLLYGSCAVFLVLLVWLGQQFTGLPETKQELSSGFGTAQALGKALYVDFFFPFEAVILLFLVALVGALYIGKREG